jgi:hypothetical protein
MKEKTLAVRVDDEMLKRLLVYIRERNKTETDPEVCWDMSRAVRVLIRERLDSIGGEE